MLVGRRTSGLPAVLLDTKAFRNVAVSDHPDAETREAAARLTRGGAQMLTGAGRAKKVAVAHVATRVETAVQHAEAGGANLDGFTWRRVHRLWGVPRAHRHPRR